MDFEAAVRTCVVGAIICPHRLKRVKMGVTSPHLEWQSALEPGVP
jgi:hypothetical protein